MKQVKSPELLADYLIRLEQRLDQINPSEMLRKLQRVFNFYDEFRRENELKKSLEFMNKKLTEYNKTAKMVADSIGVAKFNDVPVIIELQKSIASAQTEYEQLMTKNHP